MAARLTPLVLLAAGVAASAAFAAGNFAGTARQIAPTAAEAHYKALTGSAPAPKPPADKRAGYRSGWHASYLKGTVDTPVEALALVYVYRSTTGASNAYDHSCSSCKANVVAEGIRMKFEIRNTDGKPVVIDVATCRNVYVALVVSGEEAVNTLVEDAGALAGAVFRKAIALGMSPCAG